MHEHLWLLAMVWRCLYYGGKMALLFMGLALALSFVVGLACYVAYCFMLTPPLPIITSWFPDLEPGDFLFLSTFLWPLVAIGAILLAALGGMIAGFYLPPHDQDEFFFDCLVEKASKGFLTGILVGVFNGAIYSFLFDISDGILILLVSVYSGLGYGLWCGINLARLKRREV